MWEMWHRWKCVGDTQNDPDFRFHWRRVETRPFFLNLAEYVSGRLLSVWIASKVDVLSPFLSLFALDEIHVFL